MATPLRVLILDDRMRDAELMVVELRRAGFAPSWKRVESEVEFARWLDPVPDLVLADQSLPQWRDSSALRLLRERGLEVPYIIVSGAIDERLAIDCLRQGAADYLRKDRLGRLGQAVIRALEERQLAREKKRAEEALRESEELFRSLADNSPSMIFINQDGRIAYANEACEATGYTREEMYAPDFDFRRLIAPESMEAVMRRYQSHGEGREVPPYEYRILRRDGSRLDAINATRVITYRGRPAILGVVTDITERARAEEALRASEAMYRSLFEDSRDAVFILSLDAHLADANEASVELFGYQKDEIGAIGLEDLFVDAAGVQLVRRAIESGESIRDHEAKLRKKDGVEMDCLITANPWRTGRGAVSGYQVIVRDVTESKQLQRQLQLSQRLEAVGQLAGGIAHDFNNVLMAIMSSSELLQEDLGPDHPGRAEVEEIKRAAARAADLTRQLLAFSRRQVMEPRVLNLSTVVREIEKMLRRVMGENIELVTALQEDLSPIRADPGQMEQVLMNLAVNARDAMPDGGQFVIETADVELDEEYAREHVPAQPGTYAMLAVSDTGHGMDEETQARIFEPFFSTKEREKGTGLGLSTVYGIVKQSGGYVWVYSEPGRGTTFKIYLPRVKAAVEQKARTVTATLPEGSETVLVVEDEPAVRSLISRFLRRYGYTVYEASRPSEALEMSGELGEIHLLLTDVVLPEMSGRELAEKFTTSRSDLRVLYVSGYADQAIVQQGLLGPGSAFIQKPFSPDVLARKVREVLDAGLDTELAAEQPSDARGSGDRVS